jgi:hypothetical protein
MNMRPPLAIGIALLTLSSAFAGLVSQDDRKPDSGAIRPIESADPASHATAPDKSSRDGMENEKVLLNRLITKLQRSSRSFIYLRSVGFTESDQEFEWLISTNNKIFRATRIVRRDEQGQRQIPGWPGIALTDEYRGERH